MKLIKILPAQYAGDTRIRDLVREKEKTTETNLVSN